MPNPPHLKPSPNSPDPREVGRPSALATPLLLRSFTPTCTKLRMSHIPRVHTMEENVLEILILVFTALQRRLQVILREAYERGCVSFLIWVLWPPEGGDGICRRSLHCEVPCICSLTFLFQQLTRTVVETGGTGFISRRGGSEKGCDAEEEGGDLHIV